MKRVIPSRKRPITEAFLNAEERYGKARRRLNLMACEVQRLRESVVVEEVPDFVENLISNIEKEIARHSEELTSLEEQYKCSKKIIRCFIQEQILLHRSFLNFLHGFRDTSGSCHLYMLDQGPETTCGVKQKIAEFAGVPSGKKLGDFFELEDTMSNSRNNNTA